MSDVKQQILDDLETMAQDDKGWGDKMERIRGAAVARCHETVKKHLEGMAVINSEEFSKTVCILESAIFHEVDKDIDVCIRKLKSFKAQS